MNKLYSAQEKIWQLIFQNEAQLDMNNTLLCGGTALARFYLKHRISYDLDFFIPNKFNPEALLIKLNTIGLSIKDPITETREQFCRQLGGLNEEFAELVKIDFIEDIYEGMFDTVMSDGARTEVIDGLYHRKIRTISGLYLTDGSIKGGRQTARDLFDLFVLNQSVEPLHKFITRINDHGANIPIEGLFKSILSMPWLDLMDDFEELELLGEWKSTDLPAIKRLLEKETLILQNTFFDNRHDAN